MTNIANAPPSAESSREAARRLAELSTKTQALLQNNLQNLNKHRLLVVHYFEPKFLIVLVLLM